MLPELARLRLFPLPARRELGFWKGNGARGRMSELPNRYSRGAEAVLQYTLRESLIGIIRNGFDGFSRVPLAHFRAPSDSVAMSAGSRVWESAVAVADRT